MTACNCMGCPTCKGPDYYCGCGKRCRCQCTLIDNSKFYEIINNSTNISEEIIDDISHMVYIHHD